MFFKAFKKNITHFNTSATIEISTYDAIFLVLICAGFCYFFIDSGCIEHSIWVLLFLLIILLKKKPMEILSLSPVILACIVVFSLYIAINANEKNSDLANQSISRIFKFLILTYAVIISTRSPLWRKHSSSIFVFISSLWVLINIPHYLISQDSYPATGVYSNPHYLATNSILILPFLAMAWKDKSYPIQLRLFFIFFFMIGSFLFFETNSYAAFAGVAASLIFIFLLLSYSHRKREIIFSSIGVLLCFICLIFFIENVIFDKVSAVVFSKITQDERIEIWADTWQAYQSMSLPQKILGAGIGGFREIFPLYSKNEYSHFIFPHAFPIEIIFDYGLPGVIIFCVLIFGSFSLLKKKLDMIAKKNCPSHLLYIYLGAALAWILTANFVYPLLSKNTLYPFAFILGWLSTIETQYCKANEGTEHDR